MTSFDEWFYALEGYGLKAERFYEELQQYHQTNPDKIKEWLKAAFYAGQWSVSHLEDDWK